MAELQLSDAIEVHVVATQRRVAIGQTLDAMLASGPGPVTDDNVNLADHLAVAEFVERACADQVVRLWAQQGVFQK